MPVLRRQYLLLKAVLLLGGKVCIWKQERELVIIPRRRADTARALAHVLATDAAHKGQRGMGTSSLFVADLQASAVTCRDPLNNI
jgi:hypothetical protein